jgi:arabinogalactan endo-1,4-beta-galactosidase
MMIRRIGVLGLMLILVLLGVGATFAQTTPAPLTVPPPGKSVSRQGPFILGADVSWVPEEEAAGATYYDNGVKMDIFDILKKYKFNYVRLRIFVDPKAPGGYAARSSEAFCDLAHTEAMAKRIKAAGMGFLLDFHYSDTWASPGKQFKPAAWQNLDFADLTQTVRTYTRSVVQALKDQKTPPNMVEVGNETSDGMIFPDGQATNFDQFATLVKAGIAGVHDVDPKIKIMIHHHLGRSDLVVRAWVDNMLERGVKFDIIGLSCYAQAQEGDWQTTFNDLATRYPDKLVVAAEYSGRKRYLNDLLYNAPGKRGQGSFIWEPIQYREAIFDKNGVNAGGGANPPINGVPAPPAPAAAATPAPPAVAPPATPPADATPPIGTATPPTPRPFRGPRNGGRYDTNDFIQLYPQMSADYGNDKKK